MVINLQILLNLVMYLKKTNCVFMRSARARAWFLRACARPLQARPATLSQSCQCVSRFDRPAYQRPGEMSKWKLKSAFHIYSYSLFPLPSCLTVQRSYFTRKIATPEGGREAYRASAPYSPCHLVRIANIFNTKNI